MRARRAIPRRIAQRSPWTPITELGMMGARTPAEWGEWVRWCHLPFFFLFSATLLFVHQYLGAGRAWLMWMIIAGSFAILIANFTTDANFTFDRIDAIGHVNVRGEEVAVLAQAEPSAWQWFVIGTSALCLVFIADAALTCWRMGGEDRRRKAVIVGGGAFVFPRSRSSTHSSS